VARLLRTQLPDGFFHVTARGVNKVDVFIDDDDRLWFLRLFSQAIRRYRWGLDTFCLMTNHFHLLLYSTSDRLSQGMQWLNGVYAQEFNERHDRTGHLFGERFRSRVIVSEEHLAEARRYILLNPVRAGLCDRPEEWPWSGSRHGRKVS
jgi:putative transposase